MPASVIFPSDSPNGAEMADALANCRVIFFAGLPGAGKSLFVREQAEYPGPDHVLIGELPISGNRLAELVHVQDDDVEPLLAGDLTRFLVPVPTTEVRRALESKRQGSISSPQHADEARDAPMNILRQIWTDTRSKAAELGLVDGDDTAATDEYDPATYQRFFQHLLQRRNCRFLDVDTVYADVGSSHDLNVPTDELVPSADEISDVLASLEATWTTDQVRSVDAWYEV